MGEPQTNNAQENVITKLGAKTWATINGIFSQKNVPYWVWEPIMLMESGGNPTSHAKTSQEDSRGLFQINVKAHPQWKGVNLFDPVTNAQIASENFIAPAYQKAIGSGLTNKEDITAYVWKNGIRPKWTDQKATAIKNQTAQILGDAASASPAQAGTAEASGVLGWLQNLAATFAQHLLSIVVVVVGIILGIMVLKSMFLEGGTNTNE